MKIAENGAWLNETNEGHCFDSNLAGGIVRFMGEHSLVSVLDLGCGNGLYVKWFNSAPEFIVSLGVDGNPHTTELGGVLCTTADLSKPLDINNSIHRSLPRMQHFSLILSLEVGEHIPAEYESTFLDNVVKYAKDWIILSWAIPGQTGDGHVNCRPNGYIAGEMEMRGFASQMGETEKLREASTLPWFKDTLMVFKRIT